jgi:ribosomal-protein-alanine N-acetyltransferase
LTSDCADGAGSAGVPPAFPPTWLEALVFERMQPEHLAAVLAIERLSFPSAWSAESYLREMRNPSGHYCVARLEDEVIGYAGMWVVGDEAHVSTIAVREDRRRCGLGERLMRYLMSLAIRYQADRMSLEVRQSNLPAQALYAKLGFQAAAIRPHYYGDTGEDGVVMQIALGNAAGTD